MEGKAEMFDVRHGLVMIIDSINSVITPVIGPGARLQIECVMWETIRRPIVGAYTFRMIHGA